MSILFDDTEQLHDKGSYRQKKYGGRYEPNSQATANKYDEMLVFGYHCKLFRDDDAAEMVNEGKSLIPWMGNTNLMIDRYDCRGHLYRLEDFDFEGKSSGLEFSPEEEDEEYACDIERYRELKADTIDEDILQEEEEKRSKALYDPYTAYQSYNYAYADNKTEGKTLSDYSFDENSFKQYCQYYGLDHTDPNMKAYFQGQAYQYDYERPPPPPEPPAQTIEPYVAPEGIEIPSNVTVPETKKMQAIIEKTAIFISKNSVQMEIVLKAKQAGNPQFNFLNFDDYMNPYYKFILEKIKEGLYTPPVEKKADDTTADTNKDDSDNNSSDDSSGDEGELHPLLQAHRRPIAKTTKPPSPKKAEEEKAVLNIPEKPARPVGKIEDLAKIYMTMKYKSAEENKNDTNIENNKQPNDDQNIHQASNMLPSHARLPPPPPSQYFGNSSTMQGGMFVGRPPHPSFANNNFFTQQRFSPPPPPRAQRPFHNSPLLPPGEDFVANSPPTPQFPDVSPQISSPFIPTNRANMPPRPPFLPRPPQIPMDVQQNVPSVAMVNQPTFRPHIPAPMHPAALSRGPVIIPPVSTFQNQNISTQQPPWVSASFENRNFVTRDQPINHGAPDSFTSTETAETRLPSPPPLPLPPPLPPAPNLRTAALELSTQSDSKETELSKDESKLTETLTTETHNLVTSTIDATSRYKPSALLSKILQSTSKEDSSSVKEATKQRRSIVSSLVPYADEPVILDDSVKPKSILKQGEKIKFRVEAEYSDYDVDSPIRSENVDSEYHQSNYSKYFTTETEIGKPDNVYSATDNTNMLHSDEKIPFVRDEDENTDFNHRDISPHHIGSRIPPGFVGSTNSWPNVEDEKLQGNFSRNSYAEHELDDMYTSREDTLRDNDEVYDTVNRRTPSINNKENSLQYDIKPLHPESDITLYQRPPPILETPDTNIQELENQETYQEYYQQYIAYEQPIENTPEHEISRPPQMYTEQNTTHVSITKPYIEGNVSPPPPPSSIKTLQPAQVYIEPEPELKLVIDRLAIYVAKNGFEFERGIKEKNDPRFEFLNPWNPFHVYYLRQKQLSLDEQAKQKDEEEERRKSVKVSFGLKTKSQPIGKLMTIATKLKPLPKPPSSVFNHDDEEDEEQSLKEEKSKPSKLTEETKLKLQKQIEEKERLLKQLQEQAILQQNINEANRQASQKIAAVPLTPQQQASLKRKQQTEKLMGEVSEKLDMQGEKAVLSRKSSEEKRTPSNSSPSSFVGKRVSSRSRDNDVKDYPTSSKVAKKQDAFFEAINQAFNG